MTGNHMTPLLPLLPERQGKVANIITETQYFVIIRIIAKGWSIMMFSHAKVQNNDRYPKDW